MLQGREEDEHPESLGGAIESDRAGNLFRVKSDATEADGRVQENRVHGRVGEGEDGDIFVYYEDAGDAGVLEKFPDGHAGVSGCFAA
jgi:hypothetical protein